MGCLDKWTKRWSTTVEGSELWGIRWKYVSKKESIKNKAAVALSKNLIFLYFI
jgi:hypothetical protein